MPLGKIWQMGPDYINHLPPPPSHSVLLVYRHILTLVMSVFLIYVFLFTLQYLALSVIGKRDEGHSSSMVDDTLLHLSIDIGNINETIELLEHGAGINSRGKDGSTPLHISAKKGYKTIVDLLLKRNATVDIRDGNNDAPIHVAANYGHLNVVRALLDGGANVNSRGFLNRTPLHFAAAMGHADIVNLLLERNATVDIRESNNTAPINYAAKHGHLNFVSALLLDSGASVNSRGSFDRTPLL
ncbi:receptor-interacting serine/threonine-protein kinase 4-like [Halyomorpha halys]|uniref:receptor-interacting serine/threonine-protein kinase 4-like n=1 Tax=Halyomorpha halys TaxID=286706 RepID=UPI0034D23166